MVVLIILFGSMYIEYTEAKKKDDVIQRFQEYMEAWRREDFELIWEMMSQKEKHGNDNSIESFKSFVLENGVHPYGYEKIGKVKIDGGVATFEATILYREFSGLYAGKEIEEFQFVFEDGMWRFDDFKTLADDRQGR